MHELGVTKNIAEIVLKYAEEAGAARVDKVNLVVGDMRNLEEVWVTRYFRRIAKGTVAEDAEVHIVYVPIAFFCRDCGATFTLDIHKDERMSCPECGSSAFSLIAGKELTIASIEVR